MLRRLHPLEEGLEAFARLVRKPSADALEILVGREDEVPSREAEVGREPSALATHRILGHLDHDRLPWLQELFDPRRCALDVFG